MPKEDRSDWVAVEPEYQKQSASQEIRKVTTAYQYFQKEVSTIVKDEVVQQYGSFDIAKHGSMIRDKWNALSESDKEKYYILQRNDQARFAQESHLADIAALERKEKLRKERDAILYDDNEIGVDNTKRTTRHKWDKKQRKKMKQIQEKIKKADNMEFQEEHDDDEEGSAGSWDDDDSDDSSAEKRKKMKANRPKRELTQKQLEHREKIKQEKLDKESYIAERQHDLRKERADQAKRRLEFLLKQSNIFSHFGGVKEDTAKFGNRTVSTDATKNNDTSDNKGNSTNDNDNELNTSRRGTMMSDEDEEVALEEADEHEATFLTQQPPTLGFGKMRDYQLEGLNWMIRLQENGVNGILADGMFLVVVSYNTD
jgi:hypothetical protein